MTMVPAPQDHGGLVTLRRAFGGEQIRHVEHLPARPADPVPWPDWVPPALVDALHGRGIDRPWRHQAEAADRAHRGEHTIVATGTASGKSLAYQLPILTALLSDTRSTALYLAPTKALAADQLRSITDLTADLGDIRPAAYDGDTPLADRDWARDHGRLLLSNPDMLHRGILPRHQRWSRLLRRLRYVVVDEAHSYRGVFGSHIALVLRRLLRVAESHGARPIVILASATVADPGAAATRLVGAPVTAVTIDGAPHPGADIVLWEPPLEPEAGPEGTDEAGMTMVPAPTASGTDPAPHRRSAMAEAARIMAELVADGNQTLTFVRSRAGAEQAALIAGRIASRRSPALTDTIAAYRGGFLPEDRRELERALDSGRLRGVASTTALELGVDIVGMDAVVLAGFPGTMASLWQQAGRAGRADRRSLVVFVARDDPLDAYLVHHPEAVFAAPVEAPVIDPTNPYVLAPQLACAAAEVPLTDADLAVFGPAERIRPVLGQLLADRVLRRRPAGYFYPGRDHPAPAVDLRGSGGQVTVVEAATGRIVGSENAATAPARIHPGAVLLHRGQSYVVRELDLDQQLAWVDADRPEWSTSARSTSAVEILDTAAGFALPGGVTVATGPVRVTEQVIGYVRRRSDGTLLDTIGLELPAQVLDTRAVWYTVARGTLVDAGIGEADLAGALHAAEHAAIGLLPLLAGCDRWDVGGLSTALHPDTGEATVIVYDGVPGGAGFAERGFDALADWLGATRGAIAGCACSGGCPSCIQSPKCGNGNHPLHKGGAVTVLDCVVGALASGSSGPTGR